MRRGAAWQGSKTLNPTNSIYSLTGGQTIWSDLPCCVLPPFFRPHFAPPPKRRCTAPIANPRKSPSAPQRSCRLPVTSPEELQREGRIPLHSDFSAISTNIRNVVAPGDVMLEHCGVKWSYESKEGVNAVFLGTYEPRLDDKSRLILPAKYRDQLQAGLVMTRGQEHCLYVFPLAEFEGMQEQLRQAPLTSKEARSYLRVFLSGAVDEIPDKQGRVTIPSSLRTYAGLERELAVIGTGNRIEIWDQAAWNAYLTDQESAFADREDEVIPGLF